MKINHQSDYRVKRQEAYPSIADQLDMIYHGSIEEWRTAIEAIKKQYPKPDKA